MKTKRQIIIQQIELQEKIQSAGFNIVECGNCGTVLLHELAEGKIECFCGHDMDLSDCPDLYYSGIENNAEFNEN
jgi:molybdopterin/thiamine biosynthesis adenylyltransferase